MNSPKFSSPIYVMPTDNENRLEMQDNKYGLVLRQLQLNLLSSEEEANTYPSDVVIYAAPTICS